MTMNERSKILAYGILWSLLATLPATGFAQDNEGSFLRDYSKLQPAPDNPFDELYIAADVETQWARCGEIGLTSAPEVQPGLGSGS